MFKLDEEDKRKVLAKLALFLMIFSSLLMFDLVSKHIAYDGAEVNTGKVTDGGIVAWTSVLNTGSTFFNRTGIVLANVTHVILNVMLLLFVMFVVAFTEKKSTVITLSMVAAGILGNALDRMAFSGVRDIIFIPGLGDGELGVFNFADVYVMAGAAIGGLITIKSIGTQD